MTLPFDTSCVASRSLERSAGTGGDVAADAGGGSGERERLPAVGPVRVRSMDERINVEAKHFDVAVAERHEETSMNGAKNSRLTILLRKSDSILGRRVKGCAMHVVVEAGSPRFIVAVVRACLIVLGIEVFLTDQIRLRRSIRDLFEADFTSLKADTGELLHTAV